MCNMKMHKFLFMFAVLCKGHAETINWSGDPKSNYTFPKDFLFGVSTAAYQIEGAWNTDGKSESIWDHLTHNNKTYTRDGSTGDVAADSYHLYKRDAEMVHELGVDIYRFSISWSRILPTGLTNKINPQGLQYYDNLLTELEKYNVTPMVVMYHWDLPQKLQDIGGWSNPYIVDWYTNYAKMLFKRFAHRVKYWVTINEPMQVCLEGYGKWYRAPVLNHHGIAEYLCTHYLLKAHASAYHLFDKEYRHLINGKIGMVLDSHWAEPKTDTDEDHKAAELYLQAHLGWFANPIYSADGDYPADLTKLVDSKSAKQNYTKSRLPKFTPAEVEYIKGTADFFGLNHYTTYLVSMAKGEVGPIPSHENDIGIVRDHDPYWPSETPNARVKVASFGLRRHLAWLSKTYGNVPIMISENVYGHFKDAGIEDEDKARVSRFCFYINSLLYSIHEDHTNVVGYVASSLMDNFEWDNGFMLRSGLYLVDFNSPNKTRTAKHSARLYSKVIASRRLPENYDSEGFTAFSRARLLIPTIIPILSLHWLLI